MDLPDSTLVHLAVVLRIDMPIRILLAHKVCSAIRYHEDLINPLSSLLVAVDVPGHTFEGALLQVGVMDMGDGLSLGTKAAPVKTTRVVTPVICDADDLGRADVVFQVGCPRPGADLHEAVLGLFGKCSGRGDVFRSHDHVCRMWSQ
jgi:hypothetical protein